MGVFKVKSNRFPFYAEDYPTALIKMFKIKCDSFCCYAEDYQTVLESAVAMLKAYGERVLVFKPGEDTHFLAFNQDQSYDDVERALKAADGNSPQW